MKNFFRHLIIALAATGLSLSLVGCRSSEDNLSEQPWNRPKSWENGLPSGMTEGR